MFRWIIEAELLTGGQRKTRVFDKSPILVGRGEDAEFRIDVEGVSAIHGRLSASQDGFEYVDLASLNGSFLDGQRLPEETATSLGADSSLILGDAVRIRVRAAVLERSDQDLDPVLRRRDGTVMAPMAAGPTEQRSLPELLATIAKAEAAERKAPEQSPSAGQGVPVAMPRALPASPRPQGRPSGPDASAEPVARTRVLDDAPVQADAETFVPGDLVAGKFRIESVLGRGGQGTVFKVVNIQNDRPFALKVLSAALAPNAEARARFESEARAAAAIEHENVVAVLDCGTDRDVPFILMEYLRGETLAQVLKRGVLDLPQAVDVAEGVLAGLWAAHARGLVHRDVKPENIFIPRTPKGSLQPKLLDFGVAKFVHEQQAGLTTGGRVVGTCNYFSPEQAEGDRSVDARSDQYSAAVVLYRMLAGRLPHGGASYYRALEAIVHGRLTPIREACGELPTEFEPVLARALSKEPSQRYESVHHFGEALLPYTSPKGRLEFEVFKRPPIDLTKLSSVEMPILRLTPRPPPTSRSGNAPPIAMAGGTRRLPADFLVNEPPASSRIPRPSPRPAVRPRSPVPPPVEGHPRPGATGSDLWTRHRSLIVAGCAVVVVASAITWAVARRERPAPAVATDPGPVAEPQPVPAAPSGPPASAPPSSGAASAQPSPMPQPVAVPAAHAQAPAANAPGAGRRETTRPGPSTRPRRDRPAVINTRSGETLTLPSAR